MQEITNATGPHSKWEVASDFHGFSEIHSSANSATSMILEIRELVLLQLNNNQKFYLKKSIFEKCINFLDYINKLSSIKDVPACSRTRRDCFPGYC